MLDARLSYAYWALRLACGVQAAVSGLVKFNSGGGASMAMGVLELVAGVLIFTPLLEVAAGFLGAWFLLLGFHALAARGAYDMAVSDFVFAAAAYVLARLTRLNASDVQAVTSNGEPAPAEASALASAVPRLGARAAQR